MTRLRHCIVRETPVSSELGFSKKTCDLKIENLKSYDGVINIFIKAHKIKPLNHTHVLLIRKYSGMNHWKDEFTKLTVSVIRMSDCSVLELSHKFPPPVYNLKIIVKKNGDVLDAYYISYFYKEPHMCRIRCDLNVMSRGSEKCPRIFGSESDEYLSFLGSSSDVSSLSNYRVSKNDIHTVSENGTVTKIVNLEDPKSSMWSSTYSKFSFCTDHKNGSAACRQHDADGKLLFDANLNLTHYSADYYNNYAMGSPHNLQGGGFIVSIFDGIDTIKVLLVFDNGEHGLLLDLSNVTPVTDLKLLGNDTELCLYFILRYRKNSNITYAVNCIPKKLYSL